MMTVKREKNMNATQIFRGSLIVGLFFLVPVAGSASCETGTIVASGSATEQVPADVVDVRFQVEIQASTFLDATAAGDALKERIEGFGTAHFDDLTISVGHDFGILKQKKLSWSKGRKLEYEFIVRLQGIPPGDAQAAVVRLIDVTTALDARMVVESVDTSLSKAVTRKLKKRTLRAAVAGARDNAETIADAGGMEIVRLNSVFAAQGRLPGYADYDRILTLASGASLMESVAVRRRYAVDAGMRAFEVTGGVVAEFCAKPQ